jgi:hypothetical protein
MQREEILREYGEEKALKVVAQLNKRGFKGRYFPKLEEAVQAALEMIPAGASIGVGGSITIRDSGLLPELAKRGHIIHDHWQSRDAEDRRLTMKAQRDSDVFLASTNAVTLKGQLVNVDGTGNRVSSMIFGPEMVVILAGVNKIAADLDMALWMVRNVSASLNYKRLKVDPSPPCVSHGKCGDCELPLRQCSTTVILDSVPRGMKDYHVFLINESLGL